MSNEIRKTIVIAAPPQVVFRALTDEKELTNWFPNQGAVLEARVGGMLEFRFLRPDGEKHAFRGRILEIIPEKKLSYSWNTASSQDKGTITWTLEPKGSGTQVSLLHHGFDPDNPFHRESHRLMSSGWPGVLRGLGELAGSEEAA